MVEPNKFYLCDRWFYFDKDIDNKISFLSNLNNPLDGLRIEIDKITKCMDVLYFKDNKPISKLEISDITKSTIIFHYKDIEPQDVIINGNEYVNLLIELFRSIRNNCLIEKDKIMITKRKSMDKMCYLEPDFPTNKKIPSDKFTIDSECLKYFLEFMSRFIITKNNINLEMNQDKQEYGSQITFKSIKNLVVPDELEVYDRIYTFKNRINEKIIYENIEEGYRNLEINLEPNTNQILGIQLKIKDSINNKIPNSIFTITPTESEGVIAKCFNKKKLNLLLNIKEIENAIYTSEAIYNKEHKEISHKIKIRNSKEFYELNHHPVFKNTYIDENGTEYRIENQELAYLMGMTSFSLGIFRHIDKCLTKTK